MMRLLLICLLLSTFAAAQPGYTPISTSRYNWTLPSRFSGGLHIPAGGNPSLGTGQFVGAGAVYVDTTGADAGLYYYINGAWVAAGSGVDSLRRLPGSLNVQALKGGTWRTQFVDSSGGSTNSNVGTGYRLVVAGTNDIKTLFYGHGLIADSTTSANGITARADTSTATTGLATIGDVTRATANQQKQLLVSKGVLIGNSTIAAYSCGAGVETFLMTKADSAVGTTITNDAVPGHTIAQQRAVWEADASRGTYDWITVEIGLNDLDPTEAASVALARYQRLIDTINAQKKSSAVVVVAAMTPCRQRLIDLYGSTDGPVAYAKWLAMNNAIMGGQPGKITGVDYRVDKHKKLMMAGNGNLLPEYDCGDHIHETDEARKIVASVYREALNNIGYLGPQTPLAPNNWNIVVNSDPTGQAGLSAWDSDSTSTGFTVFGPSFPFPALAGKGYVFSRSDLILQSDGARFSGGSKTITLRTGGFANSTTALLVDANSYATFGARVGIGITPAVPLHTVGAVRHASLGTSTSDTTTYKPVVIDGSGNILPSNGWFANAGGTGTVTSVAAGYGITGGTITSTGTHAVDTTTIATRYRVIRNTDSLGAIIATKGAGTILGSISTNQIAVGASSNTIGGSSNFTWNGTTFMLGNFSVTGTATPVVMNSGATYATGTPGTAGNLKWRLFDDNAGSTYGFGISVGKLEYQAGASASHVFYNNGTEVFRIDGTAGSVGIGTASPASMLSVGSSSNFQINSSGKIAKYANTVITNGKLLIGHTANGTFELGNIASANSSVTVTNNAGGIDLSVATPTESTYTPTLTNTTNVAASTAYAIYYYQSGNTVWVWGDVSIDATAALTITEMGVSLPVASNFSSTLDLSGTATFEDNTTMQIKADATNDRAVFRGAPQTATNNRYSFTLIYKVIN
jgi:hypothetical protein